MKELILPPLVISLILFFGVQKFCIKRWGTKEVSSGWYWVGLLPLAFGILSYIIVIKRSVPLWGLLWVCPMTAIIAGVVLLTLPRNRFAVSALVAWIFNGPLPPALTENNLQLHQFHHVVSAAVLLVILYHLREIWNIKGALFGLASFYGFAIITVNLSGGIVNLLKPWQGSVPPLWAGVIFAVLAVVIFLWYKPGFRRAESNQKSHAR
jgi:hypothetical protein